MRNYLTRAAKASRPSRARALLTIVGASAIWLSSQNLWAQSLYQVELIIFERKGLLKTVGANLADRQGIYQRPDNLLPLRGMAGVDTTGEQTEGFTVLPNTARALNAQASALVNSRQMRVLFHQAWQQPVGDDSPAVSIEGGNQIGAQHELEGYMRVSQGKVLELATELRFTPTTAPAPATVTDSHAESGKTVTIPIRHNHRIKAGEIQYLDHPIFGILVRIEPVEAL